MVLLLAAAVVKFAAALAAWLLVSCAAPPHILLPPWYYLALALTFGAAGLSLFAAGGHGTPARYLGAAFVFFGTLFADRVLFARVACMDQAAVAASRVVVAL